jgi:hypothetical protein
VLAEQGAGGFADEKWRRLAVSFDSAWGVAGRDVSVSLDSAWAVGGWVGSEVERGAVVGFGFPAADEA